LLKTLDAGLCNFHQVLPRLDPRRSILDLDGLVQNEMFGTATVSDKHEELDDLRKKKL